VLFSVPHRPCCSSSPFLLGCLENKAEPVNGIDAEITRLAMPHSSTRSVPFFWLTALMPGWPITPALIAAWIESFQRHLAAIPSAPLDPGSYEGISWPISSLQPLPCSLVLPTDPLSCSATVPDATCTYLAQVLPAGPRTWSSCCLKALKPRHLVDR